jgi:hypothetical protein
VSAAATDARPGAVDRLAGRWGLAAAAAVALAALLLAGDAGVKSAGAVPDAVRAGAALLAVALVAGYAPTRLLLPRGMEPHFWLLVPLVGCATGGLALTLLGFVAVPWAVSLPLMLVAGLAAAVLARVRLGPVDAGGEARATALVWPALLAVVLVALALIPMFRDDLATVYGTNPDGHLSVGAAQFLQHARPETVDPSLPVDRMPLVWRSKYPIYYVLAATSSLSGLSPIEAFAAVSAVLAALTAVAFLLLARYGLRASPAAALLAMGLVGGDRLLAHLALHPYHNQLWGTLALPLMLLFGWRFIEHRAREDGVLLALFLLLGVLAYPLMAVFPALALLVSAALVQRRRGGLPRPHLPRTPRGRAFAAGAVLVAIPPGLVLLRGVFEKADGAAKVVLPGHDLAAWRGDLTAFPALGSFFGAPVRVAAGPAVTVGGAPVWVGGVVAVLVIAAAVAGLRRLPRDVAAGLGAAIGGGLVLALYFRLRTGGEYFYFKLLAFLAPLVVATAAVWLARAWSSPRRTPATLAAVAAVAWVAVSLAGLRQEVRNTGPQLTPQLLGLRDAARRLPPGSSIRLDLPPDGTQLWAGYMLASHPLDAPAPIVGTTYPHVPLGRKADYILAGPVGPKRRWPDADGPPVYRNADFRIYRMRPGVKGPDTASQTMQEGLGQVLK